MEDTPFLQICHHNVVGSDMIYLTYWDTYICINTAMIEVEYTNNSELIEDIP